eukprot:5209188-Pyramimonas_sp.AAC.1
MPCAAIDVTNKLSRTIEVVASPAVGIRPLIIRLCRLGLAPEPPNKSLAKTEFHIVTTIELRTRSLRTCPKDP